MMLGDRNRVQGSARRFLDVFESEPCDAPRSVLDAEALRLVEEVASADRRELQQGAGQKQGCMLVAFTFSPASSLPL